MHDKADRYITRKAKCCREYTIATHMVVEGVAYKVNRGGGCGLCGRKPEFVRETP